MNLFRRPLFLLALAYIAGILCAAHANPNPFVGLGIAGGILLIGIVLPSKAIGRPVIGILALIFAVGFVQTAFFRQIPPGDVSEYAGGERMEVVGKVASDPELSDRSRFIMEAKAINGQAAHGRIAVTLRLPEDAGMMPTYGQTIVIHGRLQRPMPVRNPGAFDYGEYLSRKRVYCSMYSGLSDARMLEPAKWSLAWAAAKFKAALTLMAASLFCPVQTSLLLGILLGGYSSLPLEVQGAFMRSGTMHILAASGYNCGVIIAIFGLLMRKLYTHRTAAYLILIALVWGFTLVAGASPSIVRAAIMVTVFLAGYLLWRANDLINVVLFSALIILAVNPLSLFDIGFQLSYAAVLSLMLVLPLIDPWVRKRLWRSTRPRKRLERWSFWAVESIVLAILLSVAAMIGTWPITAYYFNYFSLASIPANALVALLVVALTAVGIAVLALGHVWILGSLLVFVCKGIISLMLGIVTRLGGLSWSALSVHSPSRGLIILYYLALLGILEYFHKKYPPLKRKSGDI
ncbi:MAG TPA: ComEC/Rec2 family competence protein [Armatimonadota bacterium]|nr:ComEC/Rec2 family competence protein [Armatimonadota bacterium]